MTVARYYKPELDILRFFAFLFVFFTHRMDLAPIDPKVYYWGYQLSLVGVFGVPLFFFLSAFLITELLTKEQEATGQINIRSFYLRRILRIWPLYFTFFFGMVFLSGVSDRFGHIPGKAQVAFSLFSGNWYITCYQWLSAYPVNPLWSVSVEEQLYILLPLVARFGGRKGLKVFSLLSLLLAYAGIAVYASHPTSGFSGEWTNSFVQFQFFAAGILTSLYGRGRQPGWSAGIRILVFLGGVACWLVASIVCKIHADAPHLSTIPEAVAGWMLIMTGVVLFFLSLYGLPAKWLPPAVVYLGRISYGLYVFHITFFYLAYAIFRNELTAFSTWIGLPEWRNMLGFLIAFALSVCTAALSYTWFEQPFLRLKKRFTVVPSRD